MPKRLNPFDEDICRQRKVHVGEKEISNGVLRTNKMKQVFDNTTDRLFEGMSMWYKSLSTAKKPHDTSKILTERNQTDDILCICGHYVKYIHVSRCDYCEKSLCFPCLKECKICKNLYCPSCSLEEPLFGPFALANKVEESQLISRLKGLYYINCEIVDYAFEADIG